jgi:hypothetical protein
LLFAVIADGERALTGDPGKHRDLAEEVVEADLDRPETLKASQLRQSRAPPVSSTWNSYEEH